MIFPLIMLTAKSGEDDKLKSYDLGADDYMNFESCTFAIPSLQLTSSGQHKYG